MPINILMPALSPTMEKGNLAKWLKKEGDKVKSGDVIAEIETDKATMEVEAVDEGTIAKILVPEGTQDVAVNDVIAVHGRRRRGREGGRGGAPAAPPKAAEAPAAKPAAAPAAAAAPKARCACRRSRACACRRPRPLQRPTATPASSRHRWRGVSPRKPASSSAASTAPARTAASSRATSRRRNPARA